VSLSVNPLTSVISIPKADTTFVEINAETGYEVREFDEYAFMRELGAFLDGPQGIVLPRTHKHDTETDLAGITYARKFTVLSPYTITFENDTYQVRLVGGTNNNLVDVLNPNSVSLIPANSAGKQTVSSGSGLDAGQDTKLTRVHSLLDSIEGSYDHQEVMRILLAAMAGKLSGADTGNIKIRDVDDMKDRITVTSDANGNRLTVVLDVS